ncbi:MAG: hypothetical protein ACP6IS_05875 [Candidatus Asgardarchaeia archaeon]
MSEESKPKSLEELLGELNNQTGQVLSALNSVIINMGQIRDGLKSALSTINEILKMLAQVSQTPQVVAIEQTPTKPSTAPIEKPEGLKPVKPALPQPPPETAPPPIPEPPTEVKPSPPPTPQPSKPIAPPAQTPPPSVPSPPPKPLPPVEAPTTDAEVTRQRNILIEHELSELKKLAQSGTISGKSLAEKILEVRDKIQQQLPYSPVYHEMLMMSQRMKSFSDGTPDSNSILDLITKIEDWKKRLIK